ncbi:hypothetical protein Hanom_Chr17g01546091 [Helianthus anomalus]
MEGTRSTMESPTDKNHSISLCHITFFCSANGSNLHSSPNTEANIFQSQINSDQKKIAC